MNRVEQVPNERKEYWRRQIVLCDASDKTQKEWCLENGICSTSMSKWRNQIWREEEAEKEFAAAREEHSFVEITPEENKAYEAKELTVTRKAEKQVSTKQIRQSGQTAEEPRLVKPDAIIGYREYMIGVYENTSEQLLRKVVEVLRYA